MEALLQIAVSTAEMDHRMAISVSQRRARLGNGAWPAFWERYQAERDRLASADDEADYLPRECET